MANSSNPPDASARMQDYEYLFASNTNVSNFVSVKLSGDRNYHLWQKQMHCLMKAHGIYDLVHERPANEEIMNKINKSDKYDSLLLGWILGSLSDEVLGIVVNCDSATEVWKELRRYFDSPKNSQQGSVPVTISDRITEMKDKNVVSANTTANDKYGNQTKLEATTRMEPKETETNDKVSVGQISVDIGTEDKDKDSADTKEKSEEDATQTETKDSDPTKEKEKAKSHLYEVLSQLSNKVVINAEQIDNDIKNALLLAVKIWPRYLIRRALHRIRGNLVHIRNTEGCTMLHIAAIVGNQDVASLLIEKDKSLLEIKDIKQKTPLDVAYDNMHIETIDCLLKAAEDSQKERVKVADNVEGSAGSRLLHVEKLHVEKGIKVLENAISAKNYEFAKRLIERDDKYTSNDKVLMAIARTFPSALDYMEACFYPNSDDIRKTIGKRSHELSDILIDIPSGLKDIMSSSLRCEDVLKVGVTLILGVPFVMLYLNYALITLLLLMVYYPFSVLYHVLWNWKVASTVVPFIRNIERKKKEYDQAKEILHLVCLKIHKKQPTDGYGKFYESPILEAARQNASEVVDEIINTWPEAISCADENGYDIIQLATIHRSEKVYNMIYDPWFPKTVYRTKTDSSENNMLHLAGRLAPSNKLKLRRGAALQLQRELQWREEVKKLLYPSYVTAENIFHQTPEMVFTKEHENLVKEGEAWIKTVAKSCSITATLITTIVFAAAITVPGGSRQEIGVPVFMKEAAFLVFAISDAISLFSSITALLWFLSILTARFAEEDFLFRLPTQLIIGLCSLLISTVAMMVAFGANLYLVFCQDKTWMLAPICGLASLPIAIFYFVQGPLIAELFQSTYGSMFGKGNHNKSILDPMYMRIFFGK